MLEEDGVAELPGSGFACAGAEVGDAQAPNKIDARAKRKAFLYKIIRQVAFMDTSSPYQE